MLLPKLAVPLAVAAGLVAASPAAGASHGTASRIGHGSVAHLLGGSAGAPTFPGLVNSRLVRTQRALNRVVDYTDDDMDAKAVAALYRVRLQMKLAWRAAKYVIDTAPPPPITPDAVSGRRLQGAGGAAGAIADQDTTAAAVLGLQHTVAQTALGIIDMAHGTLRDSVSRTIFAAMDQRDAAVAYIHSIDVPPPPPGDGLASTSATRQLKGAPVGGTWATVMPPISGQVEDEINQIDGALHLSSTLGAGIKRVMKDAEFQALQTQRTIDGFWPPVVGD
jgi:hypothetical protein